jgi:uncharacterized protein (TIGR02246 family)
MKTKVSLVLVGGVVAALAVIQSLPRDVPAQGQKPPAAAQEKGGAADLAAVKQSSQEFAQAFAKGDAKAIAALWTEQGELHHPGGDVVRGRADIEKVFAEFFKENPKSQVEVLIESIRFPAPDLAIEEGILRSTGSGKELPSTTLYSVTHVRQGGAWKVAVSREWGAGQDRLEDLDWLIGKWAGSFQDQEVTLTFRRDAKKSFLLGEFTRKVKGKAVAAGTMKIGIDPQRGQLRSWHFDEDGGNGQALWIRDRNNWVLDSVGVQGDGTEVASVNVLGRVSNDAFTWRSIDRVMDGHDLPDTVPVRVNRVGAGK